MSKTALLCPVLCKYCMASKIDIRSSHWEKGKHLGINKSCTFLNRFLTDPPLSQMDIPWHLLDGEYLGFQGITDCFWDVYFEDLKWICEKVSTSKIKKLVLTSKIPARENQIEVLENIKDRVIIIYSLTGMDDLEKTKTKDRIRSISALKNKGFDVLPIVHPYIHRYSDLSFFKELSEIGCQYISWKGFRYNPKTMWELSSFIDPLILTKYDRGDEQEVLLGEDTLFEQASLFDLEYIDLKKYIQKDDLTGISEEDAKYQVEELMKIAVLSSSASFSEVKAYAIERRL